MAESKVAELKHPKVQFVDRKTDGLTTKQLGDLARLVEEWLKRFDLLVCYLGLDVLELILVQRVTGAPQKKKQVMFRGQVGIGKTIVVKAQAGDNGECYLIGVPVPHKYSRPEEFARFITEQVEVYRANSPAGTEADTDEDLERFNSVVEQREADLKLQQAALAAQKRSIEELQKSQKVAQQQVHDAEEQLARLEASVAQSKARAAALAEQLKAAEATLQQVTDAVAAAEQNFKALQQQKDQYLKLSRELSGLRPELRELLQK